MKFVVSLDAHEATLANGRPLVKGESLDLSSGDRADPFNAHLIVSRQLIAVSSEDNAISDAQTAIDNPAPASVETNPQEEGGAES